MNGQFPGPIMNLTTNWNVVVNVRNGLDEPLLITWYLLCLCLPELSIVRLFVGNLKFEI